MKRQIVTFLVIFIALLLLFRGCGPSQDQEAIIAGNDLGIATVSQEYEQDNIVSVKLKNNTNKSLSIKNDCPSEPLDVFKYQNGEWVQQTVTPKIECVSQEPIVLEPEQEATIDYTSWNHALFRDIGRYRLEVTTEIDGEELVFQSNEFRVNSKSWLNYIWGTFLYQPIFNALIYVVSFMPGHNLGLGIIVLTLMIRLILFIPSQRGLESQRKLQDLQPRLKQLQQKYKNNQQKIAQETFALYKEYKVNPFGSCLPLLIQLPILIGLFYVIQTGLNPDNVYLLYAPIREFDLSLIETNFYGLLDLAQRDVLILPLIVAGLQFIQMKLMTFHKAKKGEKEPKKRKKGSRCRTSNGNWNDDICYAHINRCLYCFSSIRSWIILGDINNIWNRTAVLC